MCEKVSIYVVNKTSALSRRRLVQLVGTGSLVGLAGCLGGDEAEQTQRRPDDWCIEEFDTDVADVERTAESIDGIPRDPDDLTARQDAAYQCHPQGFQLCANCRFFIPSKTNEAVGACAIVEGRVRSQDWCALYQHTERLSEPPSQNPFEEEGSQVPNPR